MSKAKTAAGDLTATPVDLQEIGSYQTLVRLPPLPAHTGPGRHRGWRKYRDRVQEASRAVTAALREAGFRRYAGTWVSRDSTMCASVNVTYPRTPGVCWGYMADTVGVRLYRPSGGPVHGIAVLYNHLLDGTYDALPDSEKHRMSGSSDSFAGWMDRRDRVARDRAETREDAARVAAQLADQAREEITSTRRRKLRQEIEQVRRNQQQFGGDPDVAGREIERLEALLAGNPEARS